MKTVLYILLSAIAGVFLFRMTSCDQCHYRHYQESVVLPPTSTVVERRQVSCSPEFGIQPSSPTPGALIVSWESVYGRRSPMLVDINGVPAIEPVHIGMRVYRDPNNHWTWTTGGNRVKFSDRNIPEGEWMLKTGQLPQNNHVRQGTQHTQQFQETYRREELHVQPLPPIMKQYR